MKLVRTNNRVLLYPANLSATSVISRTHPYFTTYFNPVIHNSPPTLFLTNTPLLVGFAHVSTLTQTPPRQQLLNKHTCVPPPLPSPTQPASLAQGGAPSQASSAKQIVDPELTPLPQKQVSLPPQFWKVPQTPALVHEGVDVMEMVEVRVDAARVVVVEVMLKQEQAEA